MHNESKAVLFVSLFVFRHLIENGSNNFKLIHLKDVVTAKSRENLVKRFLLVKNPLTVVSKS